MAAPADDAAEAAIVVEGVMALIMVKFNPSCYSDSSDEFSRAQVTKGQIPATWILLENRLILNIFKN